MENIKALAANLGLTFRDLGPADVGGGYLLSSQAGWNQTEADWRLMLANGQGWGLESPDGQLIASALTLPFGAEVAWISMVLVTETWRRHGIATDLLRHCIDHLDARGVTAGLDATEAGRLVYLPLGFQDIYPIDRMVAETPDLSDLGVERISRAMTAEDMDKVVALESVAFGAERGALVAHLFRQTPDVARVIERNGELTGYALGRNGRNYLQIGPLVAASETDALALLTEAYGQGSGTSEPLLLDIPGHHAGLIKSLKDAGFTRQRGYVRMLMGQAEVMGNPGLVYAITGPELA